MVCLMVANFICYVINVTSDPVANVYSCIIYLSCDLQMQVISNIADSLIYFNAGRYFLGTVEATIN